MNQPSNVPTVDVDLWSDEILTDPCSTYAQLRARNAVLRATIAYRDALVRVTLPVHCGRSMADLLHAS
jgi:hypothetical protein